MGKNWRTKYLSLAHIILSLIKANELYPTGTSSPYKFAGGGGGCGGWCGDIMDGVYNNKVS